MEFKSIPQFQKSKWQADYDLNDVVTHFGPGGYFPKRGLNLDPDFQRGHVWTEEQQIAFIEYMLRGGDRPVICANQADWGGNYEAPFELIDGKQRLNAMLRFVNNEIRAFGAYHREYDRISSHVCFTFKVFTIQTRAEVLKFYLDFNSAGTPHAAEEIARVRAMLAAEK